MTNSMRLASGGIIDRQRPINFVFNGKSYRGYKGDTLASALLANGVTLTGRSFKYHRPRGIMSAGIEETNALVQLLSPRDEPNVQATRLLLEDKMEARSINCWPSVNFDIGAMNSLLAPIFPAGFYYKTFMWRPWNFYARYIRRFAGLGVNPNKIDTGHYEKRFHHCDILIVGAGPAGLCATLNASRSGASVMLVDDQPNAGGDLLNRPRQIDGGDASGWIDTVISELDSNPRVVQLSQSLAAGYYDHNLITVVQQNPGEPWVSERFWKVRAKQVILASGSVERPLVFENNDLPGIILAASAATLAYRYGVNPGNQIVFATNNNSGYESALLLANLGVKVKAIVDQRDDPTEELINQAAAQDIQVLAGHHVVKAIGKKSIKSLTVRSTTSDSPISLSCDLLCVSGGWNPVVHLHSQSGAKPVYNAELGCFCAGAPVQTEQTIGAAAGNFSLDRCLQQGQQAAIQALTILGLDLKDSVTPTAERDIPLDIRFDWHKQVTGQTGKAFVDFQNDVTTSDIALAIRENYVSVEHVKRYTTAGMATDQGKSGNTNVIAAMAAILAKAPGEIGTTTYRPPYSPISFGAIGGSETEELIIPIRRTPITQWHIQHGAAMNEAGANYRRPFWYPHPGESDQPAIRRAAKTVRDSVGIYDGSPLGKFELFGEDAVKLLNMVYTNRWNNMLIGQGKFGLMLNEDGRMMDDGVTFRLAQHHYLMSSGTGTADLIYAHLERLLQTEFPHWKVFVTTVTNHWSNICVCGPKARSVLQKAGCDIDLNGEKFPFLALKTGNIAGIPARVARVSYTGELSYEINVQRRHGLEVWQSLMEAGKEYGISPVGSETSAVLRIEKGFVSPGSEGDNITNPFDAGMGWNVDMDKDDFIGKRTLQRDLQQDFVRQKVVGLLPNDESFVPAEGSALISEVSSKDSLFQGHVTAACYSPNLNRPICLALLKNGTQRIGETITISGLERSVTAEVTKPIFIDPKGERMKS